MKLFEGLSIVKRESLEQFDYPGVWALFGKRKECQNDNRWYCLQVASTKSIKKEILKDMQLINNKFKEGCTKFSYINQFGEKLLEYVKYPSPREYLYSKYIKEQFEDFQFIVICQEKDSTKRRKIEKEVAYRTKAIYWRNGRSFTNGKEIDFENRKSSTIYLPNNGQVLNDVIITFLKKYNNQ